MGKEVLDEYDIADIDRDEQRRGLKRRERRWKEIEFEQRKIRAMEKLAKKKAEQVNKRAEILKRYAIMGDYMLYHMMEKDAYEFYHNLRFTDLEANFFLYRIFMSPYMMERAEYYVRYFSRGGKVTEGELIPLSTVVKYYKKFRGIKTKITIKRKGGEEYEL